MSSTEPKRVAPSTRRERTAAPPSLVHGDGFVWGTFDGPVADVDLLARWSGAARAFHASRLKEWQAFQLANPTHFVLGAVYDAKLLGLVQIVVVETATGRARRWEGRVPSRNLSVARGLSGTRSEGRAGSLRVVVRNDVGEGRLAVTADDPGRPGRDRPSLALDVAARCGPGEAGHLVICHPFPDGTPLYSHKCAMAVEATLHLGAGDGEPAETVHFDAADSFLILDDHKGHYPSPMAYDWVTGGRRERGGRLVAFNLTDNQVRDPDTYNECCLWLDDAVHRLPPVHFERPGGVHQPWRARDAEGRVDVTFEPTVRNEQHVGPRSVLADYYGPFGWCSGSIVADDGEVVSVDGCFGMGEQKFIRF